MQFSTHCDNLRDMIICYIFNIWESELVMSHHSAHNLAQAKMLVKETLQYTVVKMYLEALREY